MKFQINRRQVNLSGEAYFEVTKNLNRNFHINIEKKAIIEVPGTSFNLRSDKEDSTVDVSVVEETGMVLNLDFTLVGDTIVFKNSR
jgi:transmembrane sensor